MGTRVVGRHIVIACLMAVIVFGLGVTGESAAEPAPVTEQFGCTGQEQLFTVPTGVTSIDVVAIGAPGGKPSAGGAGGLGAQVTATHAVTPGDLIWVEVGCGPNGRFGGFNGGATANTTQFGGHGAGGGGATDLRTVPRSNGSSAESRFLVAAGGGGGGAQNELGNSTTGGAGGNAGSAGSNSGGSGATKGGGAGTGTAGGPGGAASGGGQAGGAGSPGAGGFGGAPANNTPGRGGGGGGGGLFGGGGGGGGGCCSPSHGGGGGGGGSSLVPQGGAVQVAAADVSASVAITYVPVVHTVSIGLFGSGSGSVESSPAGIDCGIDTFLCTAEFDVDSVVALTPHPASGSVFTGWSGDCSGDTGCSLTMDSAKFVAATFEVVNTFITSGPDEGSTITSPTATFEFVSSPSGGDLECSVDGADFASCTSPYTTPDLGNGFHTFRARAVVGTVADPTPALRSFTVDLPGEGGPPGAATLTSPSGSGLDNPVDFTWEAAAGSTYYYLWINKGSTNVFKQWYTAEETGCAGGGTCTIAAPATLAFGDHTWWIQTWNPSGYGPWSEPTNFSVNEVSQATALFSPTGTVHNPVTFTWDPVDGSTYYYLWINKGSTNVFKQWYTATEAGCADVGPCTIDAPAGFTAGEHTWWIQTWNPAGYGEWSAGVGFDVALPAQATLVSPSGSGVTNPVTYTWNAVPEATYYYLWVNRGTTNVIKKWYTAAQAGCADGETTCTIVGETALTSGAHTWWIQTWNPAGYGPWSEGVGFGVS